MKKLYFLRSILFIALFIVKLNSFSQQSVHQMIVVSGGAFSNPNDFVSLSSFLPATASQNVFGFIKTQAVQHAIIDNNFLYVTATDSLVKFDLNSYHKLNAIAIRGPRMMVIHGELLFVSVQFPETSNFVRVYNKNTLALVTVIHQISGEAAGMIHHDDKIYVAVPGSWTSNEGKIAILNALNGTFIEEISLGNNGKGVHSLFFRNGKLVLVNVSAWGSTSGIISLFDPATKQVQHYTYPHAFGKGIAVNDHFLYLLINNGIGSIDLNTHQISNLAIVNDPGSPLFTYFADVAFDPYLQLFYASITDFFSFGAGKIYTVTGVQTGSFTAGIAAEALAFDVRTATQIAEKAPNMLDLYPNPASDKLFIRTTKSGATFQLQLFDIAGKLRLLPKVNQETNNLMIDIANLQAGLYFVVGFDANGTRYHSKFIKK